MNPCRSDCPQGDCANCVDFGSVARAFSPSLPACMGGMCSHRDHCQRHVTDDREHVVERLCQRGEETPEPVVFAVLPSFLNRSGRVMRGAAEVMP